MKKAKKVLLVLSMLTIIGAPLAFGILMSENEQLEKDNQFYKKEVSRTLAENVKLNQELGIREGNKKWAKDHKTRDSKGRFTKT